MNKYSFIIGFLFIYSSLQSKDSLSILFLGDIMQHGPQIRSAYRGGDSLSSKSYDYSSYFKHIQTRLDQADLCIGNMEFVVNTPPFSGYPSFSAPNTLLVEAKESGIDLFLCANNHIWDKGSRGVRNTLALLDSLSISHTGLYKNKEDEISNCPHIIEQKGIKIAFINFSYGSNGNVYEPYLINLTDAGAIREKIQRAKLLNVDLIIALPHWGTEYELASSEHQRGWRDFLFKNGVNYIVGTHPHVVQPIEVKKDSDGGIQSITAYSLGNYISNMSRKFSQLGLLFWLDINKDSKGNIKVDYRYEYIWCARKGDLMNDYTSIPILDFINKREKFLKPSQYDKMISTYEEARKILELP